MAPSIKESTSFTSDATSRIDVDYVTVDLNATLNGAGRKLVSYAYELDISALEPSFKKHGPPDTKATLMFLAPNQPTATLLVKLHRKVLENASGIFKDWFKRRRAAADGLYKLEKTITGDPERFGNLLIHLYDEQLSPLTLHGVFETAMEYQVKLNIPAFVEALCCRNTLKILDDFPMATPFEQPYREIIMGKVRRRPTKMLASPHFEQIKSGTLAEVMEQICPKVADKDIWEALWRWAKAECGRRTIQITPADLISVIPNGVKKGTEALKMFDRFSELLCLEEGEITEDREADQSETSFPSPPRKRKRIEISVVTPEGTREKFTVSTSHNGSSIRSLVASRYGVPEHEIRLYFDGTKFWENETIQEAGIEDQDELEMYMAQVGC